jgi:hypothetical protein
VILMINLFYGFAPGTNIDNMGHIGGLLGGVFFAWKAGPLLKLAGTPPFFSVTDGRRKSDILTATWWSCWGSSSSPGMGGQHLVGATLVGQ